MISINKQGNAIIIEFTDNDKYLFNGKIEVAPNELIVVTDDSEMATFRKSSNGDVLFSQLISDIQIAGSPVTKDTIINQFATIGFISGGGSGEDTVSSVNGQTGDVVITATSLGAITKADADTLYATKSDLNSKADISAVADMATQTWVQGQGYLTEVPSDYVTNSELTEGLAGKLDKGDYALKSDLNTLATKEELATKADASALSSKLDTLVSGTNIKTINGDSILGNGNLVIQSGASNWDDIQGKPQFARVATSGDYNDLINKPTIPDVSGLATKEEIADMETKSNAAATYATKDEIPSLEGYLTETGASETYATKLELGNKLDTATYNSEKAGFETKENASATYATKSEMAGKQDTLVSGTNIKTINGNSILGEGNITVEGGSIDVDNALSSTSENPVLNKVITLKINSIVSSESVKLGNNSSVSTALNNGAIAIGRGAAAGSLDNSKYGIAIGAGATTTGNSAIAIGGYGTSASAPYATAVGSSSDANEDGSTVIGAKLKANKLDGSTPEKVLVGYYDTANSTSVPVLAYNESDGARIKSGSSLKKIATDDQLPSSADITKLQSLPNFVTLTQSEYDALATKDANTVYLIKEA